MYLQTRFTLFSLKPSVCPNYRDYTVSYVIAVMTAYSPGTHSCISQEHPRVSPKAIMTLPLGRFPLPHFFIFGHMGVHNISPFSLHLQLFEQFPKVKVSPTLYFLLVSGL